MFIATDQLALQFMSCMHKIVINTHFNNSKAIVIKFHSRNLILSYDDGISFRFSIDKSVKYFLYALILILKKTNVYFYIFSSIFYFDLSLNVDGIFDLWRKHTTSL